MVRKILRSGHRDAELPTPHHKTAVSTTNTKKTCPVDDVLQDGRMQKIELEMNTVAHAWCHAIMSMDREMIFWGNTTVEGR